MPNIASQMPNNTPDAVGRRIGDLDRTVRELQADLFTARGYALWLPNRGYRAGELVVEPGGTLVVALEAHTSGAVFSPNVANITAWRYVATATGAITTAQGTWASGATDGVGGTAPGDRFRADFRNGLCIVHIDWKRGTAPEIIGTLPASVPAPPSLIEAQAGSDGFVWIYAGSRDVHAAGPGTTRYEANLPYLY